MLDVDRPEVDVGEALPVRLGPREGERRLGDVDPDHLPGGAHQVRRGQRGGAGAATGVEDAVSRTQSDPGDGPAPEPVPERQRGLVEVVGGGRVGGRGDGFDAGVGRPTPDSIHCGQC